jgi:hypothetical protein
MVVVLIPGPGVQATISTHWPVVDVRVKIIGQKCSLASGLSTLARCIVLIHQWPTAGFHLQTSVGHLHFTRLGRIDHRMPSPTGP